ncbi:AAA family ATPase [Piscinibacter koreensis]|uniref:AAA family ATPase n=1 Tax=Piscinibacter koreensis TaxID=2742824 RepID=A0A7Y6NP27_9BURK|nr:AAA family ATPase [Schlegelella koreensis]NUZ06720.1 AAA family ATPase [Schlegelella koreensis]
MDTELRRNIDSRVRQEIEDALWNVPPGAQRLQPPLSREDELAAGADDALKAEQLRTLLREMCDAGKSLRTLAVETKVSHSVLTKWLTGSYPGDNAGVLEKLRRWEHTRSVSPGELRYPGMPTWVPTQTGRDIETALAFAQREPSISVIFGGAGVGKTTAIRRYAEENNNVWVTTSSPARGSMAAALSDVADTLGMRGLPQRPDQVSRDIMQALRGTEGLLIVDEAQHLSVGALEELRSIHDSCEIGLCLSGNDSVYSKMTGGGRKAVFAQLFSRIGWRLPLRGPTAADVDAILDAWKVPGAAEHDVARRIASKPGGLRGLFQVLRQARIAAAGAPVTAQLMSMAWRDLGGDA